MHCASLGCGGEVTRMWTDSHAHLGFYGSPTHVSEVLDRAQAAGVTRIVNVGDTLESCRKAVKLAERFGPVVAAVGVHPHGADQVRPSTIKELRQLAAHPKVVAVGEIGLDYYRDRSPHSRQAVAFRHQLELASELGLPVIIHNREANEDVLAIIEEIGVPWEKVLMHCFSGDRTFAREVVARGCCVSLAGPLTFTNPRHLPEVSEDLPMDRVLLETDSPFLAPHPYRGQTNEPAYLPHVGRALALIRGVTAEEVARVTSENAARFFGLPPAH